MAYRLPKWAKGLPEHAMKTFPVEWCPQKSTSIYHDKWIKPRFSLRKIADARKRTLMAGQEWIWEKPGRRQELKKLRPRKGHKRHQGGEAKKKMIEAKMAEMPQKIEKFRIEQKKRRDSQRKDFWSTIMREINK
mmetsp:Transcript_9693/g.14150  ORF Transcript_9693/g.14150 Transcript_9693/m.14150 type:complete len:134 (-) Transcript_9693:251-652(-)|eukprot:CAMPEP_0175095144 /NCGR_PEP_ID=MMETSP0086_2-20121207/3986_1 /TAXON_ID=136419 /ORGANISM="Unknown Unknown, Strain D1" /LENGTH=133 /DNA_ID=CAMNT_0016368347 /DNA_START=43 /DNA_END=444 /DNA_ORIENTATION=+